MSAKTKKRILLVSAALLLTAAALWVGLNLLADPFGVFGSSLFRRPAYRQAKTSTAAALVYLDEHHEQYDSYVLGASSAAAYSPEVLNAYTGGRFYNLSVQRDNAQDFYALADYLTENYEVRELLVALSPETAMQSAAPSLSDRLHCKASGESAAGFYLRYAFADPRHALRKIAAGLRGDEPLEALVSDDERSGGLANDLENVGDAEAYAANHAGAFVCGGQNVPLPEASACVQAVERLRALCEERGVRLTVVFSPVYGGVWERLDRQQLGAFRDALAEVTEYWDFAYSSVSADARCFTDKTHFRAAVGTMALARIFGDDARYIPEDFGRLVTQPQPLPQTTTAALEDTPVPILMYHHFSETGDDATTTTPETFRAQLEAIRAAGYHAVSVQELYDYVYRGAALPDKPFCITIDDGYRSNYELAYPILKELNMKATIFCIGFSVGQTHYKDTGNAITPHFSFDEAREMTASGLISVQCHTYDMHQWPPFETGDRVRETMSPLPGESQEAFVEAILADTAKYREMYRAELGGAPIALAYPEGVYSALTEAVLHPDGFAITVSTDPNRRNVVVKGLPQTLYAMGRLNVTEAQTPQELVAYLQNGRQ